jgi:hypothetical protein
LVRNHRESRVLVKAGFHLTPLRGKDRRSMTAGPRVAVCLCLLERALAQQESPA